MQSAASLRCASLIGRLRIFAVTIVLPLICAVTTATAQDFSTPTDAELHTAYCIPVIKAAIEQVQKAIAAVEPGTKSPKPIVRQYAMQAETPMRAGKAQEETLLNRLQAYLIPRLFKLDPVALAAATGRADADLRELTACVNQCVPATSSGSDDKQKACADSCEGADLTARLQACQHPNWLPF